MVRCMAHASRFMAHSPGLTRSCWRSFCIAIHAYSGDPQQWPLIVTHAGRFSLPSKQSNHPIKNHLFYMLMCSKLNLGDPQQGHPGRVQEWESECWWFYGFKVLWFLLSGCMVWWFHGIVVLWFYGFVVLWFYGFMAFWCYGFVVS